MNFKIDLIVWKLLHTHRKTFKDKMFKIDLIFQIKQ